MDQPWSQLQGFLVFAKILWEIAPFRIKISAFLSAASADFSAFSAIKSLAADLAENSRRDRKELHMQFALQIFGDLFSVEAPVLDEDLIRARSGNDHSGNINAVHVAFKRDRIAHRAALLLR